MWCNDDQGWQKFNSAHLINFPIDTKPKLLQNITSVPQAWASSKFFPGIANKRVPSAYWDHLFGDSLQPTCSMFKCLNQYRESPKSSEPDKKLLILFGNEIY